MLNIYASLAKAIIKQQELIVGPLAWSEANKVAGLVIKGEMVVIKKDGKQVLERLVNQYETLFGMASVEVCKDAVRNLLVGVNEDAIPNSLF